MGMQETVQDCCRTYPRGFEIRVEKTISINNKTRHENKIVSIMPDISFSGVV